VVTYSLNLVQVEDGVAKLRSAKAQLDDDIANCNNAANGLLAHWVGEDKDQATEHRDHWNQAATILHGRLEDAARVAEQCMEGYIAAEAFSKGVWGAP
jgi:hypothetical protein